MKEAQVNPEPTSDEERIYVELKSAVDTRVKEMPWVIAQDGRGAISVFADAGEYRVVVYRTQDCHPEEEWCSILASIPEEEDILIGEEFNAWHGSSSEDAAKLALQELRWAMRYRPSVDAYKDELTARLSILEKRLGTEVAEEER